MVKTAISQARQHPVNAKMKKKKKLEVNILTRTRASIKTVQDGEDLRLAYIRCQIYHGRFREGRETIVKR